MNVTYIFALCSPTAMVVLPFAAGGALRQSPARFSPVRSEAVARTPTPNDTESILAIQNDDRITLLSILGLSKRMGFDCSFRGGCGWDGVFVPSSKSSSIRKIILADARK